jgi:hypothetical protein
MRVEHALYDCTWLPDTQDVCLVGVAGVYFFTFSTGLPHRLAH